MTKKTLTPEDIVTETKSLGRRAAVGMIGAVGATIATVGVLGTAQAQGDGAQPACSDSDPRDPAGYGSHCGGSGCSDSDPYDPGGNGRHCGGRVCSDSDPSDPAGRGRHC
jgi:hypothetical protein